MSRSGALKWYIDLYKKDVGKNQYGEYTESWVFNKKIRAYVFSKSGKQVETNNEIFDSIIINIKIRNQHDIEEMDRIKYNGKFYQIDFIQPDDTRRWLYLKCVRVNE
jgi:SPP1 family predicted phage head-tail adaptor